MRRRQLTKPRKRGKDIALQPDQEINLFRSKLTKQPHPAEPARPPSQAERVTLRMPSDLRYLEEVLDYLCGRMLELGIVGPGDCEVLVALDEAIVNAIKHGNKSDPRKAVHIVAEMNAEGAQFTVRDEGCGFFREQVPDPTEPCRLLEPSGRGLLLIQHIMDEVCYNDCGNEIRMFKRSKLKQRRSPEATRRRK